MTRTAQVVLSAACVLLAVSAVMLAVQVGRLDGRVTVLERACVPVSTGGGVTQCAQPTRFEVPPR